MIENIVGNNFNIIIQNRLTVNNVKIRKYKMNNEIIMKFYLLSIRNSNNYNHDYNYNLLKKFNINEPKNFQKYCFGII